MSDYLAVGICLLLAWTWVCLKAGELWTLRRQMHADLNARDQWVKAYQRRNGEV